MKRYRVVHKTAFEYDQLAVASYNEARMLPARDEQQIVFSSKLDIRPSGANFEFQDFFDTRVVFFEALEPHKVLHIVSDSIVEIRPVNADPREIDWDELKSESKTSLSLVDYLAQTVRTQPPSELQKFVAKLRPTNSPSQIAIKISEHIHQAIEYKSGITGVHSVAGEAWKQKVGVCQDFAHLVIGALRYAGIPARYVSGYLHPKLDPELHVPVMGESHAWVEWYVGDWVAFDPTNNVSVIDRHVLVGRGRDYDDVAPLKGVFAGASSSTLTVSVELTREL